VKLVDRLLQRWRVSMAAPYLGRGKRVLDIGCADGALFRLRPELADGVGIDPDLDASATAPGHTLVRGLFPDDLLDDRPFDVIALLAVLEHVPLERQSALARDCARYLKPGGHLVITVPSPAVDHVLALLLALRLIHGMSLEQHFGFEVASTRPTFEAAGLRLVKMRKFQLGLNNLFVFQNPPGEGPLSSVPGAEGLRSARIVS
jgi:SAM-dependent methyltransferase